MEIKQVAEAVSQYAPTLRHTYHFKLRMANILSSLLPDFVSGAFRSLLYRWAGFDIGHGVFIMGNIEIVSSLPDFYTKLSVGDDTVISNHVTINLDGAVHIGRNVCVSPYVLIYSGSHRMGPSSRRMGEVVAKPVRVEDGAWVRLGAILLPGVTVGQGSVVGAGAVVFEDVPANTYVTGNPAQVMRNLHTD